MNEFENSTSGTFGTIIYMAPEVLLKKNYDYLIDSFSAGIVLYILCSGGMHPFYSRGFSQKEYIDKLISQKCLCKFSTEMPLLARNLFLKLCKFEPLFRYSIDKALLHPWITRSSKSPIPLTIFEEYNKSDKIKTFKQLLISMICLVGLKKFFEKKRKKKEIAKNNSYYYENNNRSYIKGGDNINNINDINNNNKILNSNKKEKNLLLTSAKRRFNNIYEDSREEIINSANKINIPNSALFNIKSFKNINKIKSPIIYPQPIFFANNGISFKYKDNNQNKNFESNSILKTQSFKENEQNIQKKKISNMKNNRAKSNSGPAILDNKEKNNKDKESVDNKTIQNNGNSKKKNNLIAGKYSASKSSKNNNHKFFLRNHIIIESKNNNKASDSRKNNNSSFNLSVNKNNNDESRNTNMNAQMRNKLKELKKYNQMYSFQKVYNKSKNQNNFFVLRNVFNNSDF